jgi:hypothetical protein
MRGEITALNKVSAQLIEIDLMVNQAMTSAEDDSKASPILRAIVRELQEKSKKTISALDQADGESIYEHIVELEEAADCAKVAAQTDQGVSNETRRVILEAHDALSLFKAQLLEY